MPGMVPHASACLYICMSIYMHAYTLHVDTKVLHDIPTYIYLYTCMAKCINVIASLECSHLVYSLRAPDSCICIYIYIYIYLSISSWMLG